jgi:hypothetical protein
MTPSAFISLKNMGCEAIRLSEFGRVKSKERDIFDYA